MLHMSDEGWEGQQRWREGLLQPLPRSWACRWGKRYPKREMLPWKGREQCSGVWLQRAVPVRAGWEAAIRQQTGGSDPCWSLGRVGKPVILGVRVFIGTSRQPRHGQPVLGVHGMLPGI